MLLIDYYYYPIIIFLGVVNLSRPEYSGKFPPFAGRWRPFLKCEPRARVLSPGLFSFNPLNYYSQTLSSIAEACPLAMVTSTLREGLPQRP